MAVTGLLREFLGSVETGVDRPPQCPGGPFKEGGQFDHFGGTDDEHINVASGGLRAAGNRAINSRHFNFGGQWGEFVMKDIHQTGCFDQQAAQFWENWAFLVGLKIGAVSAPGHFQDARLRKFCQITLQRGGPDAKMVCQFRRVNGLMRIQEQGGQQPLLGAGKKSVGDGYTTHYAYNTTHTA